MKLPVLACMIPGLVALSLIRKLHKLSIFKYVGIIWTYSHDRFNEYLFLFFYFSLFADFANVFAYLVVFWFDFEHASHISMHPKEMDLKGLPFFTGVAIYCYEGAGMILSLEASIAKDYRSRFKVTFWTWPRNIKIVQFIFSMAIMAMTALYILFGVCGYLSFGVDTQGIITLNLPAGPMPLTVKGCLCFSLFFTYPVMLFPVG